MRGLGRGISRKPVSGLILETQAEAGQCWSMLGTSDIAHVNTTGVRFMAPLSDHIEMRLWIDEIKRLKSEIYHFVEINIVMDVDIFL